MSEPSYTFYTYSHARVEEQAHWMHGNTAVEFFTSREAARNGIAELRRDLSEDPDHTWRLLYLEEITLLAFSKDLLLSLLNRNMQPLVLRHEVVETIGLSS